VIVHADEQERRAGRGPRDERQPPEPGLAEYGVMEHDHVRRDPVEPAQEIAQVGHRADRRDPELGREEAREHGADPLLAGGDQD
jgi:hypothetical protein